MEPRLLSRKAAAAYVGLSASSFTTRIARKVPGLRFGRRILWDRLALDAFIDRRSGVRPQSRSLEEALEAMDADQGPARP